MFNNQRETVYTAKFFPDKTANGQVCLICDRLIGNRGERAFMIDKDDNPLAPLPAVFGVEMVAHKSCADKLSEGGTIQKVIRKEIEDEEDEE